MINLKSILLISISLVITSFDGLKNKKKQEPWIANFSSRESLLKAVRAESKVKEALVTDAKVLYVAVLDDGTRRNGYASYICELVKEHDTTVVKVKVVKFGSTNDPRKDNAYGILLGESWCK